MNTFYIARHGETENNVAKRFSGWIDTPLTQKGIKDAQSSAAKLKDIKLDLVIASDLGRAFTTAYIIAQDIGYSTEISRLSGLREVNYGDFAQQLYAVYPHMTPSENAVFVSPGGESLIQMQARVLACVQDINSKHQDQTILIVAHDGTINAIRESYTHETMGTADTVHNAHDYIGRFTFADGHATSFEEFTGS